MKRKGIFTAHVWMVVALALATGYSVFAQPLQPTEYEQATQAMEKIRAQKLNAKQAWDKGLLDEKTLFLVLSADNLLDPGRGLWNPARETHDFVQLFLAKFPQWQDDPTRLNDTARIRIGIALLGLDGKRGAALLEDVLAGFPVNDPNRFLEVGALLYRLTNYYIGAGLHEKAVETAFKVEKYTDLPMDRANGVIGAAHAYRSKGDNKKAKEIYERVIGYGYGWASGHALSALAQMAFAEGKLEEGRAILKRPIEGDKADQIRVVLNSQLAQSYFRSGEWDEARWWAQATIDQYKSLANPIKDHGLEHFAPSAQHLLEEIEQWRKSPLRVYPDRIRLRAKEGEAAHTTFSMDSFRAITPTLKSESPHLSFQQLQSPHGEHRGHNHFQFYVRVAPEATAKVFETNIEVRAKEFPDVVLSVPVKVEIIEGEINATGEATGQ